MPCWLWFCGFAHLFLFLFLAPTQVAAHSVEWKAALLSGYSILVTGFGSKKTLLDLFAQNALRFVSFQEGEGGWEAGGMSGDSHAPRLDCLCLPLALEI